MARLRIEIEMNKGRLGVPLEKLAAIVTETDRFFHMLAEDVQLSGDGEWIGLDFSNGSLKFAAEYAEDVTEKSVAIFTNEFGDIAQGRQTNFARPATRYQYARIATELDDDEIMDFRLHKPGDAAPEALSLSKRAISVVLPVQEPIESHAGIQGTINSVFLGSVPRHFTIRELSSGLLISCEYPPHLQAKIGNILRSPDTVIHVYGTSTLDLTNRKIEKLRVERIDEAVSLSDKEFDAFFGCAPDFTGDESTQRFISRVRRQQGNERS